MFLAREPIVNRHNRILGYQIRVGDSQSPDRPDSAGAGDAARPGSGLNAEEVSLLGRGRSTFFRVTRESLVGSINAELHPRHAVIELPSSIAADKEVRAACANLRERGYRVSIDDFSINAPAAPLAEFANYLKVDCAAPDRADARARTVACFKSQVAAIIGTGVNTHEDRDTAAGQGVEYFQGFMLNCVDGAAARGFSPNQIVLLKVLGALSDSRLSIGQLEDLIKHDPALCYRILRTVNSAAFALRQTVTSMNQAILLLGRDTIRRWASLWTMAGIGADAHDELVAMAALRARLCESLIATSRGPEAGTEAFLVGMCSMFDAILNQPISTVVAELPLAESSKAALCGEASVMRTVLDCVIAHERGRWVESGRLAASAKVNPWILPGTFMEALRWVRELDDISAEVATQH
jgi:EAL and modified HD-GYP domain-containing signal transduction protein